MKRLLKISALITSLALVAGCSTSSDSSVESARFALDNGDWNSAIVDATKALEEDPSSVDAALALSDAYAGRGGIRTLRLLSGITDASKSRDLFDLVQDTIFSNGLGYVDMNDLALGLETLSSHPQPRLGRDNPLFSDYCFQIGLLLLIEAYLTPSIAAQHAYGLPIDVSAITQEIVDLALQRFLEADDYFIESGLSADEVIVVHTRQTYCVLKAASVSSEGFDAAALRDLVLCQLSPDDGAALSRTNGDFESPGISSCLDFAFDACVNAAPTEP